MALANDIESAYKDFHSSVPPDISAAVKSVTPQFVDSFDESKVIRVGDSFPHFELPDASGRPKSNEDLLSKGPVLVSFYRGEWCPYCSLELNALQKHLDDFKAKGVSLVAISPELPAQSLSTTEKKGLGYTVLSDTECKLAEELGILVTQPESMRPVFRFAQIDWQQRYGTDSLKVPIPASFLVDQKGLVRNVFVDPDYHKRLEPATALEWVDAL